jgi:septal ring factor EnvC (AmiA/AmiB activator)
MARPKGSKNKVKVLDGIDYAAQIAEKNAAAESLAQEIAAIGDNIATLTADRKAKHVELNKLNKEIAKLEKKKAIAEQKIAEAAKKAEAENVLKKLLNSGMSADEILEKLK